MYRAHCAVIFAIAQLSCFLQVTQIKISLIYLDIYYSGLVILLREN